MAGSDRTQWLGLNQWDSEDRPRREDFNRDREMVDQALEALEGPAQEAAEQAGRAAEQAQAAGRELAAHSGDGWVHIGAGEMAQILAGDLVSGSYEGNGRDERAVSLGFEPGFAVIWCESRPPVMENEQGAMLLYRDYCVPGVECPASETYSGGLYVFQANSAYNGFVMKLNESGRSYRYVAWR